MHHIHVAILNQLLETLITLIDPVLPADLVELLLGTLADRVHIGMGMILINRNEFLPKTEPNNGNVDFLLTHIFIR